MGTRSELANRLFTGGMLGPLAGVLIGRWAGGLACTCANVLAEVCMVIVVTLESGASASYAIDVRAGTVSETEVSIAAWVGIMIEYFIDVLARTANGNFWEVITSPVS